LSCINSLLLKQCNLECCSLAAIVISLRGYLHLHDTAVVIARQAATLQFG
jgi:hypothetical protein